MPALDPLTIGIILLATGAVFFVLARLLLRIIPYIQPAQASQPIPDLPLIPVSDHKDAALLIQPGGRVVFANEEAREWFGLGPEELPHLEYLARRARPRETFLSLCAKEGQARFSMQGLLVEGSSYAWPHKGQRLLLLTMRRPQLAGISSSDAELSEEGIAVFSELSQEMTASLDLETTLQAVLENVDRLIPSDISEITLWDAERQQLIPYRFLGMGEEDRTLQPASIRYSPGEGYSGHLIIRQAPLLIQDVDAHREIRPAIDRRRYPIKSFLGCPLMIAGEPLGTLELASLDSDGFTEGDLEILRILSGQAAVAIHNALVYQQAQERVGELAGLANLAQAVSALQDPQEVFERLIHSITPLLEIEVLGLLLHDESSNSLVGQVPFLGLPDSFVEFYRIEIQPDSPAESIWRSGEIIRTEHAPEDERLQALGLAPLAQAAGIEDTALIPLTAGGRPLGYLQAANKIDRTPLTQDELRILTIIAGQAGPLIENANLIQASRRRARQAEALRRIASLVGSDATLDEVLKFSLQELARLLDADAAVLYLYDPGRGELVLHARSLFGVQSETLATIQSLPLDETTAPVTVTASGRPFLSEYIAAEPDYAQSYHPIMEALHEYPALMGVPLIARDQGLGEVLLGARKPGSFDPRDTKTAAAAARQIAGAIERADLYSQTDATLRERVDRLTALTRVSRELHLIVEMDSLLEHAHREALNATQADCGTVVLFQPDSAAYGAHVVERHAGELPGTATDPLVQIALEKGAPQTHAYEGHEPPPHPNVRSALAAPIGTREGLLGYLLLHSTGSAHFDETSLKVVQTLTAQIGAAVSNARRYEALMAHSRFQSQQVDALNRLLKSAQAARPDQALEDALQDIARALHEATPFQTVLIQTVERANDTLRLRCAVGLPASAPSEELERPILWSDLKGLLDAEFRHGSVYFLPHDRSEPPSKPALLPALFDDGPSEDPDAWHPHDLLFVPLYASHGNPLGVLRVDAPSDGRRPDAVTFDTLEVVGQHAAMVIERFLQIEQLQHRAESLEAQQARSHTAAERAREQLPVLLHKDLEQTIAIHDLYERSRRVRAGLDIAEIVNHQPDRAMVLWAMGQEMVTRMNFDAALVAEPSIGGPRLLHSLGAIPEGSNPEALIGQRNPLRTGIQSGETILVPDVETDPEWQYAPLLNALSARGFICLPIASNGQVDAAVLAISHAPLPRFDEEDEQSFHLLVNQVAITLQNLNLLTETRRRLREVGLLLEFSRQLGSFDPDEITDTLLESSLRVITSAHAGLVLLWEPEERKLIPRAASGYTDTARIMEITYGPGTALPGQVFSDASVQRIDEVDFAEHYRLPSESLLAYREATGERVPIASLLVPLQSGESVLGVLVLDNFNTPAAFTDDDEALVTSLAQQTALALENARLYQAAEQRSIQMQALTDVAATITSTLQTEELIGSLLDHLQAILPFDTGTLWRREDDQLTVRAAQGFEESEQRLGLTVAVEDSRLLSEMLASGLPINVGNVDEDQRFPSLPEHPYLSWLGIPLTIKGEVIGVIALENAERDFYTTEHVQLATNFAGQAAVALENARLYADSLQRTLELDRRTRRLDLLNRISTSLSESLDTDTLMGHTLDTLREAMRGSLVSAVLFAPADEPVLQAESPPQDGSLPQPLPQTPLFDHLRQSLGVFNTADAQAETDLEPLSDFLETRGTRGLLALPLVTGSELHGLLFVHSRHKARFPASEVELARTIANQAAVAYQNARLFEETRRLTEDLEARVVERTDQLEREHQRTRILLDIMTELSASLDMDIILNRTLALINEISGAEQSTILLVRLEESSLFHRASRGYTTPPPEGGQPTALKPDEGLAGWVIQNQQPALVDDLQTDPRWISHGSRPIEHRSCIAVPLMVGEEALGTLMLFHREIGRFSEEQLDLIQATAKQIAVAINNAQLFRLIADQSERLGAMLRSQQIETSRSRAILESVADGVLVTDANGVITLFNASGEAILDLPQDEATDHPLESFTGLFGGAAREWIETIQTWSEDPSTYQRGDTYAAQIELEEGQVVAVSLAPVILRDEFLGTVSIFRDITHQVEVDRLKSEFVATVSHELRTPMTSIKGYVEVLLMGAAGELNDQQTEYLQVVRTNTERLNVLVDDLLDISRIETRRVVLSMQPLDLREIAHEVVAELLRRSRDENKPMVIEMHPSPGLPRVVGDPDRVRQILFIMMDNAYNYTPVSGRIELELAHEREELVVSVSDTGIGLSPADRERVFERFYRGEDPLVLATAGTGLGLSIAEHLVEMHQGRVWVESPGKTGDGTTFYFTLPVYVAESEEDAWPES